AAGEGAPGRRATANSSGRGWSQPRLEAEVWAPPVSRSAAAGPRAGRARALQRGPWSVGRWAMGLSHTGFSRHAEGALARATTLGAAAAFNPETWRCPSALDRADGLCRFASCRRDASVRERNVRVSPVHKSPREKSWDERSF